MKQAFRRVIGAAFAAVLAAAALAASTAPTWAQSPAAAFPAKPIRIVVPFAPGGATDVLARMVAEKMTAAWGQPVVVENKPGAGGNIGAEFVAKAPGDGYTLLLCAAGFMAVNPALYEKLPYDPVKDYAPVTLLVNAPLMLVVHPSLTASSARDLIAWAKANPGKLVIGNGGKGTAQHLAGELFTTMANIDAVHVPYKGSAPATVDLLAGQVQAMIDNPVTLVQHVKSGKLRALGVSSAQRIALAPDLPTIQESGLPGYVTGTWYGVVAPAATPKEIVAKLNAEIARILALPDVKERLLNIGLEPVGNTPEQFGAYIRSEIDKFGKLVKTANIKAD